MPSERANLYAEVTLEGLATAHLEDALVQLKRSQKDPLRYFLAARSIHLALVTVLTNALAGTDLVGAMTPKSRGQWLDFTKNMKAGIAETPEPRMASFVDLLELAQKCPVGWFSKPLIVTEAEHASLFKLNAMRDWTERPRPIHHYLETRWMQDALATGLAIVSRCLEVVWHRYNDAEQVRICGILASLKAEMIAPAK